VVKLLIIEGGAQVCPVGMIRFLVLVPLLEDLLELSLLLWLIRYSCLLLVLLDTLVLWLFVPITLLLLLLPDVFLEEEPFLLLELNRFIDSRIDYL